MIIVILLDYLGGIAIFFAHPQWLKKLILFLTISSNLVILIVFKYLDFVVQNINTFFGVGLAEPNIVLPVGISFYIFQGLSYVIDLYGTPSQKKTTGVTVQKNPLKLALFISLFPQLIAGPIVRYKDIVRQIDSRVHLNTKFTEGICRFVIGLTKKVVFANCIGKLADSIFTADVTSITCATAWIGAISYTCQIYYDFSGYSDMAIGLGKMFGFDFCENFNFPYSAKSISEFWHRWHISLSQFFRDYVYIPLGGSRKGNVYWHIFVVFFLTGIWHGASWTFIVWGIWHGFFRLLELKFNHIGSKIPNIAKRVYTMMIVIIGWVIFRSDNITYALAYIQRMFNAKRNELAYFSPTYYLSTFNLLILPLAILMAFGMHKRIVNFITERINSNVVICYMKYLCVIVLFAISVIFLMSQTYNPFIYFRF